MDAVLGTVVYMAVGYVVLVAAYHHGRVVERHRMRHESGWWDGFRCGAEQAFKKIQEDLATQGVALNREPKNQD